MNYIPIYDPQVLQKIHRKLETVNDLAPFAIESGKYCCGGPSCRSANESSKLNDFEAGWHVCDKRLTFDCDYKMVCNRCFKDGSRGYK